MPEVKFVYFDGQAKGELGRILLSLGGIDFKDERISVTSGAWPLLKPSTPFGQLPLLYWDGEELAQSMAIARWGWCVWHGPCSCTVIGGRNVC